MGRAKRQYVAKVRGCFECSQRRIHCDRTQPRCRKCLGKGIRCSGMGVRYRFATDVSARTRTKEDLWIQAEHCEHLNPRPENALCVVKAMERHLLQYFSSRLAPILVTVDDKHNGWRRLVLPLSHHDDLVRSALISASGFCATTDPGGVTDFRFPEKAYQAAIRGLRQRQDLGAQDLIDQQCVILTLLILVVVAIVKESDDFRAIFKLLETSVRAVKIDDQTRLEGELGNFLETQISRFRGYATPFLNRDEAISTLGRAILTDLPPDLGWRDFMTARDLHPELSCEMSMMYKLKCQACEIYLARAEARVLAPEVLIQMVEEFMETLSRVPAHCPSEHGLVWPCFIVALASSTPNHRRIFFQVLLQHKRTRGFASLNKALHHLERAWAATDSGPGGLDWVRHLTEFNVFVY